jgi:release factor glutamine methyltransferase
LTIRELKSEFQDSLIDLYPSEEVQSFFSILSEEYLNLSRIETVLKPDTLLSDKNIEQFKNTIKRLKDFEPIQYILGKTEFYSLPFIVNQDVLIPRPETEELVDWIINDFKDTEKISILDIGTGSGCIGISLAYNIKNARVSVLDVSEKALSVAKENTLINKVDITFLKEDILKGNQLPQKYNIIVSNPPYVRISEKEAMKNNVLKHEPGLALFVENNDPLLFYEKIASLAQTYLLPEGCLYFEINEYLGNDMKQLLKNKGFKDVDIKKDMFGKDRMVKCRKDG